MIRILLLAALVSGCTVPIKLPDAKTCRAGARKKPARKRA